MKDKGLLAIPEGMTVFPWDELEEEFPDLYNDTRPDLLPVVQRAIMAERRRIVDELNSARHAWRLEKKRKCRDAVLTTLEIFGTMCITHVGHHEEWSDRIMELCDKRDLPLPASRKRKAKP